MSACRRLRLASIFVGLLTFSEAVARQIQVGIPETQTNFSGIYYYGHVLAVPAAVKVGAVKVIWEE